MVKVKLFANFREAAGEKEVEIRASNTKDLIDRLISEYPAIEDLVNKENYLHVTVNGRYVNCGDYKSTQLTDEDVVTVFPPVSGG